MVWVIEYSLGAVLLDIETRSHVDLLIILLAVLN